ncbi:MAG: hypothetical protein ACI9VR_001220 [Cognaticolwellia sp.]|jgi:hypothetical protein
MILTILLSACTSISEAPQAPELDPRFLRDGLFLEQPVPGSQPAGSGHILPMPWTSGQAMTLDDWSGTAPLRAECLALFSEDLGDASRLAASGAPPPDTALAFSPDGSQLAVGSFMGQVLVLDAWSGEVISKRTLGETMVKFLAWSNDGKTLYAAEQSPDALVHALDPASLESRWTLRLADRVQSTPMPAGDDRYGLYDLPAAYGLSVLADGSLIVAAAHGWTTDTGRRNQSQVLHLSPQGKVLHTFPEQPVEAMVRHPRNDGEQILLVVTSSSDLPAPAGMPVGGVQVLSLPDLLPTASHTLEPLLPHFSKVFLWEALDIQGDRVLLGPSDGRVVLLDLSTDKSTTIELGTPVLSGEVPIASTISTGMFYKDQALILSSETSIPWGAAAPELRPPSAHPRANAIWSYDMQGELNWTWSGEQILEGMTPSPDGRFMVVGAGPRSSDTRRDLYGALVFDLEAESATGEQRLQAFCATESPIFFRQAATQDGRIAVVEHPIADEDGSIRGAYQVTVLR